MSGTVTYKGQPVTGGDVTVANQRESAIGAIGEGGRYVVRDVPLGDVDIAVNTEQAQADFAARVVNAKQNGDKGPPSKFVGVPAKYSEITKTPLRTKMSQGDNIYDIKID